MLNQHRAHCTYILGCECFKFGLADTEHDVSAAVLLLLAHHMVNLQGAGAGALAVGEHMQARDLETLDKPARLIEQLRRLAAGAHYEVHADEGVGHHGADALDFVPEKRRVISAAHQPEHLIGAILERNVEMWHKPL